MARMSIDDMLSRDPRITVLASILGWSRRETAGCLVMDVWPICYDQRTHLISERVLDAAAGHVGFAKAMVEAELAEMDRSGKIHVRGARERIEYLERKRDSGRLGGIKSAESRLNDPKQTSSTGGSTPQARRNPPSPASAPDHSPAPPPVSDRIPAPPSTKSERRKCRLPADWVPRDEERRSAVARGLDCDAEAIAFRDWHDSKGEPHLDWDAAFRTWLRNAVKFGRASKTKNQTGFDAVMRIANGDDE